MVRLRTLLLAAVPAVAAAAVVRHLRGAHSHHDGDLLVGNPRFYDIATRVAMRGFYRGVAADVAAATRTGARVLEVGCGPGHLALRLAHDHNLDVTGVDLDPPMIELAREQSETMSWTGDAPRPTFRVGDAAALPFPYGSFDVVVSTLSMHHWADPAAGLSEVGRVLRPGGHALIWDLRPRSRLHADVPDPVEHLGDSRLRVIDATPWSWPWRFRATQRVELTSDAPAPS
ncbi:MAG: class I SAM-dependent methyltransferase [Nitriliruptorales bacterium]